MKRYVFPVFAALLLLISTGCIETHLLVKVRPDGSGTLRETVKLNSDVLLPMMELAQAMNQGEAEEGAEAPPPPPPPDIFSEDEIRSRAASYGEGVRYLSHERIDTEGKSGYSAEYAFSNINALKLNSNPAAALPDMPGQVIEEGDDADDLVLFTFTKGSPSRLIIRPPAMDEKNEANTAETPEPVPTQEEQSQPDEAASEEMKKIFSEMRVSIRVQIDGDIVGTNASYRDGSTITILDIDFSKLMENEETIKQLEAMEDLTPAQMKELVSKIPGITFDSADEIEIRFK
ncbi:MAG: hypothetical protein M5R41_07415 [Bacteroidia bacterium]|nr:hypothetical protein [Bacteroidia bacterium]